MLLRRTEGVHLCCHSSARPTFLHSSAEGPSSQAQWTGPGGLGMEELPERRPPSPKEQGCRKALALARAGIT